MIEILTNKYFIFGVLIIAGVLLYQLFNKKEGFSQNIDNEYYEVLNSKKYKVKNQYEN